MYEKLVKDLRIYANDETDELRFEAADAIEALSAAVEGYESSTNMAFDVIVKTCVEKDGETVIEFVPKWIPVTERLPEFDQKVLAWVKNKDPEGRFNKDGIYTAELKDKVPKQDPEGKKNFWGIHGYDSVWTVWSWSYFTEPDVLYWMPLPEQPKEGST